MEITLAEKLLARVKKTDEIRVIQLINRLSKLTWTNRNSGDARVLLKDNSMIWYSQYPSKVWIEEYCEGCERDHRPNFHLCPFSDNYID